MEAANVVCQVGCLGYRKAEFSCDDKYITSLSVSPVSPHSAAEEIGAEVDGDI